MSASLGEHEVERDAYSKNNSSSSSSYGGSGTSTSASTNISTERPRERVVMPAEIASLPSLEGYVAFAGDLPIARITLNILQFENKVLGFKARDI